jgi:hypothetical protein
VSAVRQPGRRCSGSSAGARMRAGMKAVLPLLLVPIGLALAGPARADDAERGRLLYETHCIACHSTQMHWRDNRRVSDWASLLAQVQLWQAREQLAWTEADVRSVAQHLNQRIYRLPAPEQRAAVDRR